jgi:cell division protein FtsQ
MVSELDSGGARYSQDLSEVDLSDLEDVKVRVNDPAGDVLVHLGSSDYLHRFKIYVSHAQGWRQQFQKLESVNLRYDNQVIVNPDMEKAVKPLPLSATAARTAAAAGVKPAALITRLPITRLPNNKPVPKPAFELTEKKLDPKAAAAAPKKTVARSRTNHTTNKTRKTAAKAKTTAGGKKLTHTAKPAAQNKKPGGSGGQKPSAAVAKSQSTSAQSQ